MSIFGYLSIYAVSVIFYLFSRLLFCFIDNHPVENKFLKVLTIGICYLLMNVGMLGLLTVGAVEQFCFKRSDKNRIIEKHFQEEDSIKEFAITRSNGYLTSGEKSAISNGYIGGSREFYAYKKGYNLSANNSYDEAKKDGYEKGFAAGLEASNNKLEKANHSARQNVSSNKKEIQQPDCPPESSKPDPPMPMVDPIEIENNLSDISKAAVRVMRSNQKTSAELLNASAEELLNSYVELRRAARHGGSHALFAASDISLKTLTDMVNGTAPESED